MNALSIIILMLFAGWVGWRLATYRIRQSLVLYDGRVMTHYQLLVIFAKLLWHNARKRPRMMGAAILNVLRRPRRG